MVTGSKEWPLTISGIIQEEAQPCGSTENKEDGVYDKGDFAAVQSFICDQILTQGKAA